MHPLRDYQHQNINEILACLQRGDKGTLYVLPTGGGKTVVFSHVTRVMADVGRKVAIFVHRRELLRQASAALNGLGVAHELILPGRENLVSDKPGPIVWVASIDTVAARFSAYREWLGSLDLAVWDEAHHLVAPRWRRLAAAVGGLHLGVTATPFRTDGRGLGDFFTMTVHGPTICELIRLGHLAPPLVYAPPGRIDLSRVRRHGGDYAAVELALAVDTAAFASASVEHLARLAPGVPCLAFCASVIHARHVAEAFRAAGIAAAHVDGTMADTERRHVIASLSDGRITVLTCCDLVSEGTDIPAVEAALLLRPTLSTGLYLQQIGRVLRPHPHKAAAIIIDLVGNSRSHGLPDAARPWSLHGGIRGLEHYDAVTRRCRACHRVHVFAVTCPGCGKAYPVVPSHPDNGGVAGFSAERIRTMNERALVMIGRSREDWEKIASIRGYPRGWIDLHLTRSRRPTGRSVTQ